jgi:hypothetical protein
MKTEYEAPACLPGRAGAIELNTDNTIFENKSLLAEHENIRLKARIAELEGDLQTVFLNVVETFEAISSVLKDQAILRGKDMALFMEPAKEATKQGDSIRLLALARQGISRARKAMQSSPVTSIKGVADQAPPLLVAMTKVELRALEIKEKIEANGSKTFSSRDARQYLAGKEGQEPSRRDTIRALKRTVKLLPRYVLEVTGNLSRLICKDTRSDIEIAITEKEEKRSLWQRTGMSLALPWLNPDALRANSGGT